MASIQMENNPMNDAISPSAKRQEWIEQALKTLRNHFWLQGYNVPDNLRVTIGFPKGGRTRIGECHFTEASTDQHFEIFVSPELGQNSQYKDHSVIEVIAHEICHTIAGHKAGHKKPFKNIAIKIGLEGKMTSTIPGPRMLQLISDFEKEHGPYPAGALTRNMIKKKQTYLLKCECQECGYNVRVTAKWIDAGGTPVCPTDMMPMEEV